MLAQITAPPVVINRGKLRIYDVTFKHFEKSSRITLITRSIERRGMFKQLPARVYFTFR